MTNARSFSQMNYKKGYEDAKAEYEFMLNKIRAEIEAVIQEETVVSMNGGEYEHTESKLDPDDVFRIIDKYKAESEETE